MKTQNFIQRNSKGRLPSVFCLSVCVLWVRHELGKMGISFQASLPVYCHFKLSLLVCIGCSALRACSAQGEHSCSKTSPFLKGGLNALSDACSPAHSHSGCTNIWPGENIRAWALQGDLLPWKSSQGCDPGTAREVLVLGRKGSNHCKQILCLVPWREPSLRGLFADWVFSIAAGIISQGCKACTGGDHTGAGFELESCKLLLH